MVYKENVEAVVLTTSTFDKIADNYVWLLPDG